MKQILSLFIMALLISGCVPTHYVRYDIGLKEVERPLDAKKRYGEQKIIRFQEEGKTKYSFEDGLVKIVWLPSSSQFGFILTNKTSHSVKIIWDETVYVDESGMSKRVMHSGVKYINKSNPQPPTTVVRGATISDIVFPTDNVYYVSGKYGGWRELPLLPNNGTKKPEIERKAKSVVGKNVQVLLPIKIEGVINEYVFVFSIDGYDITTK